MTCYFLDLGSASDWLEKISLVARPIRYTTQIWVVTRHQYGISTLVSQTSCREEIAQCRLFSMATKYPEKLFRESGPTLAFARGLGKKRGISLTNVRETVDKFLSPFKKPRS